MSTPSTKDPNTAMVIEILAGYFGFLGMGYLYAGRTAAGLLRLFGWWAFIGLAALVIIAGPFTPLLTIGTIDNAAELEASLNILSGGLALMLIGLCCLLPVMLATPVISGLMLKRSLSAEKHP
jgi:TM2 domain-containing membrane protein YozV